MNWFFTESSASPGDRITITGEDADHITRSLRMAVGEVITLCDPDKNELLCLIEKIDSSGVHVVVSTAEECQHEPDVELSLYFALTKGDKPESVIQKSVELGVSHIIPVLTERCVSRPDKKSADKKLQRYRKIALQAAMQSRRGIIPSVGELITLEKAASGLSGYDMSILFYEGGGEPLRRLITPDIRKIAIFIGPEGGFGENECDLLCRAGAQKATLGKRILRAETAPLAAIAAIMLQTGNLE